MIQTLLPSSSWIVKNHARRSPTKCFGVNLSVKAGRSGLIGPSMRSLWEDVRPCFDTDDGSLPGIEIAGLSSAGVSAVYAMLRSRSRLCGAIPTFWSRTYDKSIEVDSVPDAAALVVSGEAEPFHHCIEGMLVSGVELPVLGVFVWQDGIELDYRMGQDWGPAEIAGFFELLRNCCALDPAAAIAPAELEGPPDPELFLQVWLAYAQSID